LIATGMPSSSLVLPAARASSAALACAMASSATVMKEWKPNGPLS
jgi:hypothetical protein